ncbi:MAG: pilin [Lysobacterales bacterium]
MSMIHRIFLGFVLVLLGSCGGQGGDGSSAPMATTEAQEQAISQSAWLRDRLPADSIVYLRLPSPWRALFGPAEKATDRMFQSQAYVTAIAKMRADFAKDPVSGETAQPLAGLLYRLGSPIELATIAAGRMASPAANVYATMILDYPDAAALAATLAQLPDVDSALAFDDQGYAQIALGSSTLFLHFDAASKRLSLLGGMFANLDAFKTLRQSMNEAKVEPRAELALEREIDAAGHGMVLWADMEALRPILSMGATDEFARMALDQTKRIALGWGTVAGHGRLSLRAEIAGAGWSRYLPQSVRSMDIKTAGTTRAAFTMAWPTGADVQRMQKAFAQDADAEGMAKLAETDAKLKEATGLSLAEWFAPFGPELVVFADDAGDFSAIRLQDAAAFKKVLDALQQKLKAKHEVTERGGASIHHLRLPGLMEVGEALGDTESKMPDELWAQLYARAGSHVYWVEQDGWLILASVPQPLIDRAALGTGETLQAFISSSGSDPVATFSAAGVINDATRRTYYAWLGALVSLADIGGAEVDMVSLPTARELGLPRETAMGMSVDLSPQRIHLDLNYDQHPGEFLGAGDGMTTIAVVAVLAAIAIPAYQDYIVRTEVSMALAQAAALKLAISEHYYSADELPKSAEALGIELPMTSADGKVTVDLDAGAILITFGANANAKLHESYLYLLPAADENGNLSWRCGNAFGDTEELLLELEDGIGTDIADRYLPASCRET